MSMSSSRTEQKEGAVLISSGTANVWLHWVSTVFFEFLWSILNEWLLLQLSILYAGEFVPIWSGILQTLGFHLYLLPYMLFHLYCLCDFCSQQSVEGFASLLGRFLQWHFLVLALLGPSVLVHWLPGCMEFSLTCLYKPECLSKPFAWGSRY